MLEADLDRYYGRDLAEEIERAGCRKLWVWVNGLPPEAATFRKDGQQWTSLHELLALNAEVVDRWGLVNAQLKSTKRLKAEPLHVHRPGEVGRQSDPKQDRVVTDPREIAAWFS